MNKNKYRWYLSILMAMFFVSSVAIAAKVKGDNEHARKWNKFANDVLQLHKQLTSKTKTEVKTQLGGYSGNPKFYKQESYYAKSNGDLISVVQWELKSPHHMHSIEVFVRDKKGRILRDYSAAYLPDYRNAPTQTLVSLHAYNGELHAFRTFEATGDRIVERCTGKLNGEEVNFILDEDEIAQALDGESDVMEQADYKACFKGISDKAGKYLTPQ